MISQGEGCREDVGGGWQHTRQTLEKSPTSKLYTTWAHILSDRHAFAPRGGGETAGSNAPGAFLVIHDFLWWSLAPDLRFLLGQTFIRQNFHASWCRK